MTSDELKKAVRARFPTLKKPWFGRDVIECRDREYKIYQHHLYIKAHTVAWQRIRDIEYAMMFPDCDDFVDMKRGLFKIEWLKLIQAGEIPVGSAPIYASVGGYNPHNENHAYNFFLFGHGHVYIRLRGHNVTGRIQANEDGFIMKKLLIILAAGLLISNVAVWWHVLRYDPTGAEAQQVLDLDTGDTVTDTNSFDKIDTNFTELYGYITGTTTLAKPSDSILQIGSGEGAVQLEHVSSGNYFAITPYDGGAFDLTKQFFFDADADGSWFFEAPLYAMGGFTVYKETPIISLNDYITSTHARFFGGDGTLYIQSGASGAGAAGSGSILFSGYGSTANVTDFKVRYNDAYNTIWHAGNDGVGSGLVADMIPSGTAPTPDAVGEIFHDTDGANVTGDATVVMSDASGNIWPVGKKLITLQFPFTVAGAVTNWQPWLNDTGMVFTVTYLAVRTDTENLVVTIDEFTSLSNITHLAEVDSLTASGTGTGIYYVEDSSPTNPTIEADHGLSFDISAASEGLILVRGWFNANID